jgi:hypothetical protein
MPENPPRCIAQEVDLARRSDAKLAAIGDDGGPQPASVIWLIGL